MKKFQVKYSMKISFSKEVFNHHFSLRCIPKSEARQSIGSVRVRLNADYFAYSDDGFGNHFIYGYKKEPHKFLDLYVETKAVVDWQKYDVDDNLNSVFCLPTPVTDVRYNLNDFYYNCEYECKSLNNDYEKVMYIMQKIYYYMQYEKNVTNIKTTADEAFFLKKGVCQDYAQIMLAILRKMKIPARYVAGIMEKETLTHAWVEAYLNNRWYGFDPTNNLLVNDSYIVFSRGRDYSDCLVNKGIFFGPAAKQIQDIFVSVKQIENINNNIDNIRYVEE